MTLTHDQKKALAARLRKSRKVNSTLVDIEWHKGGVDSGLGPGTVYKATIKLKEGSASFLIYLPVPRNSRQTALAVLCREFEGLTLGIPSASVSPT
jgi:hypothetical protein